MIRKRITRTIAGIISCILVGVFTADIAGVIIKSQKYDVHTEHDSSPYEMNDIYYKLWAVGNMWLRNLDENGKFKGTEELKKQTVSALQELNCMDSKGNIQLNSVGRDYEYLVSYGSNSFSNTDRSYDEFSSKYFLTRKNDNINMSGWGDYHWSAYNSDCNLFDTNYGMHYYYICGRGIALYDYDTTGLNSYVDELGATLYYKTDGSTPLPDEYYNYLYDDSYDDYESTEILVEQVNIIENANVSRETLFYDKDGNVVKRERTEYDEYGEIISHSEITENSNAEIVSRETIVYNENDEIIAREKTDEYEDGVYIRKNGNFVRIEQEKFKTIQLRELPLTIAIQPNDKVISEIENYYNVLEHERRQITVSAMNDIPFLVAAFILMLFVLITGGYSTKEHKFVVSWAEKVFAEIPLAVGTAAVIAGGIIFGELTFRNSFITEFCTVQETYTLIGFLCAVLFGIVILMLNTLIIRIKCRCFWKSTFIYVFIATVWDWIKNLRTYFAEKFINYDMLRNDKFTRRFIFRTVAFSIAELFFMFVCMDMNAYGALFVFSFIMFASYIALSLLDLNAMNRISKHITAINQGDYSPHTENIHSSAFCITQKLNNISAGIQSAVDRQVQSERMKIDLVTNVSHDLKTPLTSIISYIDLLSSEELSPEAKDYVNIIEGKAQRLKIMVADLFDLAKATSHTDVDMEKIDAVILANQVLADLSDKIESSGKQLKADIQAESAPVMAEGKKMYRVLQNIIDNALKYSLEGTRVYFTLRSANGYCYISVKNIASYEMNFSPDEIMERFTRGDESRSTDGNGLGLSIAKSFTEACGGSFGIVIDGDLFTAEVRMPIYTL